MAFFRKAGSILGRTMSSRINQKISLSKPSIWQAIRCMSTSRILIQGLPDGMDDTSLREAFEKYGEVVEARAKLIMGCGVVAYSSTEEASAAVQALHKKQLPGNLVIVSYDGGGGFKGGNFGSGGGKESNRIGGADEDTSQDDSLVGSNRDDDDDDISDEDLLEGSYSDDDNTRNRNNYGDRRLKRYLDIFDR